MRPNTLVQSPANILASIASDAVALMAQRTLVFEQRRSMASRSISDIVLEVEGAFLRVCRRFSKRPGRLSCSIPPRFSPASPSLGCGWFDCVHPDVVR